MITIREATIEDLQTLQDIGIATYKEHFSDIWTAAGIQSFLSEDFSVSELQKSIGSPIHHCWLIALNEEQQAVGFSKVNWSKPIPMSDQIGAELQNRLARVMGSSCSNSFKTQRKAAMKVSYGWTY